MLSNRNLKDNVVKDYDFLFIYSYIPIRVNGYVLKHLNYLAEELSKRGYSVALKLVPLHTIRLSLKEFKNHEISLNTFLRIMLNGIFFINRSILWTSTRILRAFIDNFKWQWNDKSDVIIGYERFLPNSKRFVINSWESADFLINKELMNPCYYIIYHNHEKDFPKIDRIISRTYEAPFHKIVTTEPIRNKFNLDEKFKMKVALDPDKIKKDYNAIRIHNSVLIPLRGGSIKGSYYALKAIDIVLERNKDIVFYAFGDLPYKSESNRIIFLGKVSDEELLSLYNNCEIFVLPSIEDGIPGPALEAMMNGCAPICTNVSGASEIIENQKNGIIVPIKNEVALAEAILFLNSKPDLIKKFKSENSELLSKFTPESMCDSFLNCIQAYESKKDTTILD